MVARIDTLEMAIGARERAIDADPGRELGSVEYGSRQDLTRAETVISRQLDFDWQALSLLEDLKIIQGAIVTNSREIRTRRGGGPNSREQLVSRVAWRSHELQRVAEIVSGQGDFLRIQVQGTDGQSHDLALPPGRMARACAYLTYTEARSGELLNLAKYAPDVLLWAITTGVPLQIVRSYESLAAKAKENVDPESLRGQARWDIGMEMQRFERRSLVVKDPEKAANAKKAEVQQLLDQLTKVLQSKKGEKRLRPLFADMFGDGPGYPPSELIAGLDEASREVARMAQQRRTNPEIDFSNWMEELREQFGVFDVGKDFVQSVVDILEGKSGFSLVVASMGLGSFSLQGLDTRSIQKDKFAAAEAFLAVDEMHDHLIAYQDLIREHPRLILRMVGNGTPVRICRNINEAKRAGAEDAQLIDLYFNQMGQLGLDRRPPPPPPPPLPSSRRPAD